MTLKITDPTYDTLALKIFWKMSRESNPGEQYRQASQHFNLSITPWPPWDRVTFTPHYMFNMFETKCFPTFCAKKTKQRNQKMFAKKNHNGLISNQFENGTDML